MTYTTVSQHFNINIGSLVQRDNQVLLVIHRDGALFDAVIMGSISGSDNSDIGLLLEGESVDADSVKPFHGAVTLYA